MTKKYNSFAEFWPFYLNEHSKHLTRVLHFIGTAWVLLILPFAIFYSYYLFLAIPIVGYGFAWSAHFYVEHNKPATFKYPVWSLIADFKMFFLMCAGKIEQEVAECKKKH